MNRALWQHYIWNNLLKVGLIKTICDENSSVLLTDKMLKLCLKVSPKGESTSRIEI